MRSGFPFPIVNGELWDGSSWHRYGFGYTGGSGPGDPIVPTSTLSIPGIEGMVEIATDQVGVIYNFTPVVGDNTPYPIGLSFNELVLWYWRIKLWYIDDAELSGPSFPSIDPPPSPLLTIYSARTEFEIDLILGENGVSPHLVIPYGFGTNPFVNDVFADAYLQTDWFSNFIVTGPELAFSKGVLPRVVKVSDLYYPLLNLQFEWSVTQTAQIQFTDLATGGITLYGGTSDGFGATTSLGYDEATHEISFSAVSGTVGGGSDTYNQSGTIKPFKYYKYDGPGGPLYDEDTGILL